jgi:ribosomal protein S18 acetylase RimI-like enzyme
MTALKQFQPEGNFPLIARPALPKDAKDVMDFTHRIWEGEDYVPNVWMDWLADTVGRLAVVEWKGHVVGTGKLTQLSQDQWWLEGLRVHPDFEGRGIASHLNDYLLDIWQRTGSGFIRLATASTRIPVRHLCERSGFRKIGEFSIYVASGKEEINQEKSTSPFTQLDHQELQNALDFIAKNSDLQSSFGLMDLGWEWATPKADLLEETILRKQVMWWKGRKGLLITREDLDEDESTLYIEFLVCNQKDMVSCLRDFRWLASQKGFHEAKWIAPCKSDVEARILKAGFQRQWDNSLLLFEKEHPSSA